MTMRVGMATAARRTPRKCAVFRPSNGPSFGPEVSPERAEAIWSIGRAWVNETNLHYYLFDSGPFAGDAAQHDVVRGAFEGWKDVGIGLNFTEVDNIDESELRIGFRTRPRLIGPISAGTICVSAKTNAQ